MTYEKLSQIVTLNRILDHLFIIITNARLDETSKEELIDSLLTLADRINEEANSEIN